MKKRSIKKSWKFAEGFGPAYDTSGNILPKYKGLGPSKMEDVKMKTMPKPKTELKPKVEQKIKKTPKSKREPIRKVGKRYFA
jgi:hypothetical protein